MVENLALQIATGKLKGILKNKRILKINLRQLIADSTDEQDMTVRMERILGYIEASQAILYIDNISGFNQDNPLFGAKIAEALYKPLGEGRIQAISAATAKEYKYQIALNSQLKKRFSKIDLDSIEFEDQFAFIGG